MSAITHQAISRRSAANLFDAAHNIGATAFSAPIHGSRPDADWGLADPAPVMRRGSNLDSEGKVSPDMSTEDNGVELTDGPVKTADNVLLDLIRGTIGSHDATADGPARIDVQTPSGAMRLYLDGPTSGPAVLFLHGFPEIAYSWRHQFQFLAQEGYRVIAPDLPGTGASDYHGDDSAYTSLAIVEAIACCLDALGLTRVHIVGHDWGARHAWAFARERPQRAMSVFTVNGPWQPRSARRPLSMVPQDRFSFLAFLASPSANRILDEDPARTLRFFLGHLYGTPDAAEVGRLHTGLSKAEDPFGQAAFGCLPPWLSETELHMYVSAFQRTGFGPSLARY